MTAAEDSKVPQVRIQLLDSAGEWFTPHQVHAVRAALHAIREDIAQYRGSYSDGDLRGFRAALHELDAQISKRIGAESQQNASAA
jgi:hypothetical protein